MYHHWVEDNIFFERLSGRVCLSDALNLSAAAQKSLQAETIHYRVIDFLESEIDSLDQQTIDQLLSTKLLKAGPKRIKILLVVKDNDELLHYVIENIKSFTSENMTLFFFDHNDVDEFINRDNQFSLAACG